MKKENRKTRFDSGFTLVELLLVVTILGVLATMAVMNFGGIGAEAKIKACQSDIATIQQAVMTYEVRYGKYPQSLADLTVDVGEQPALLDKGAIKDKWDNEYSFKLQGAGHFEIRSAGPDGAMNTADDLFNSKAKQ